jgi:phosphoglycerate dehydrogenase-like enzyme
MIGAAELRAMRSSAYLINVARGEVVDEAELVRCLQAEGIAGGARRLRRGTAAAGSPPWKLHNAVLTPHISGVHRDLLRPHAGALRGQPHALLGGQRCATSSTSALATRLPIEPQRALCG